MKMPIKNKTEQFTDIDFLDTQDVVSTMDCTGLIPTPPVNDEETDAYTELYPVPEQGDLEDIEESIERQLED